jgi:hypothetical protein
MYFFTHLFIAKVLYRYFAVEVELDKRAFSYGNIKPDLPSPYRNHHTLENCLLTVCERANQLTEEEVTQEEFSEALGEICHYVCDFFCYYHLNEELHNKKLHHFFYEIRLHLELFRIRIKQKFKLKPSNMEPRNDISSMILQMRNDYFSQPKSIHRDIEYAFTSTIWVCESIIYYYKYFSVLASEATMALYSFLIKEGGSI